MEFWPEDNQNQGKGKSKRNEKNKGKTPLAGTAYLELGRLEAATLVENDKSSFEWTSPLPVLGGPKIKPGSPVEVFKPTRPSPLDIPSMSIVHRAEQGANFLRTYFPDIDIAAELVREELSTDEQTTRALKQYDPFSSNVLELLHTPDVYKTPMFLAFPMGVTGCDLNISHFTSAENQSLTFEPSNMPTRSFSTPILQLASSQHTGFGTFLAARTCGSTNLLHASISSYNSKLEISEPAVIVREDIGERPPVDIKFLSRQPELLLVNDEGAIYKCGLENGQKRPAYTGLKNPDCGDKFWQLALAGDSEDGCLLSSSKIVHELDFRMSDLALPLLNIDTSEKLTCIENSSENYLIYLASTERVLWLDRRFPGKALFGIKHRRNHDRTLSSHTLIMHGRQHTLLTSRKNKLVTVYDVTRSADQLLHMDNMPYSFSFNMPESQFCGNAYVHSADQLSMFRISDRGRISYVDLVHDDSSSSVGGIESRPVDTLESPEILPDAGPLGAREFSETNLRPAYEQLFPSISNIDAREDEDAEAVYDLLEEFSSFWQKSETPVEQVLTTYDVLFQAGEEPNYPSRADILTETVFNSTRGFRILSQGRLPIEDLIKGASWHLDIAPIIGHFDDSAVGDINTITDRLRNFDLAPHPDNPAQALRRQSKACEQLALDLTLSKDIFSTKSFSQCSQPPAGEASASSVQFHYLEPISKRDHYSREDQEDNNLNVPQGVQLLLEDWDVGADPENYVFSDTYSVDTETRSENRPQLGRKKSIQSRVTRVTPPSSQPATQLPPSIAILPATVDTMLRPPILGVESQMTQPEQLESQLGPLMASTQVLPGPFGGRPGAAGKKKAAPRKRVGGF